MTTTADMPNEDHALNTHKEVLREIFLRLREREGLSWTDIAIRLNNDKVKMISDFQTQGRKAKYGWNRDNAAAAAKIVGLRI